MGLGQADGGGASPEVGAVGSDVWSVCRIVACAFLEGLGGQGPTAHRSLGS